ncbi:MAG: hypothetical protein IPK69_09310 [Phycisphaerales bacterium]|nr:MAG: hypothetical protein IPK69_09310 [Phycisphaerales bacterium]
MRLRPFPIRPVLAVLSILLSLVAPAMAQDAGPTCTERWRPMAEVPGVAGVVRATVWWDRDGDGPGEPWALVGGVFHGAGGVPADAIAAWDPATGRWSALVADTDLDPRGAIDGEVDAIAIGPSGEVYAGGYFAVRGVSGVFNLARWDGTRWTGVGGSPNFRVTSLHVSPAGDLYASGTFTSIGSVACAGIARFDGSTWSRLGSGLPQTFNYMAAMLTLDDGSLLVGGRFSSVGGVSAFNLARWDGVAWHAIPQVSIGQVFGLTRLENGDIAVAHYAGVGLLHNGTWSSLPDPPVTTTLGFTAYGVAATGGEGLVAVGIAEDPVSPSFSLSWILTWDGSAWSGVQTDRTPYAVAATRVDGGGVGGGEGHVRVVAGGSLQRVDDRVAYGTVLVEDGVSRAMGEGFSGAFAAAVAARWAGSSPGWLVAGGDVVATESFASSGIALWDGSAWRGLESGVIGRATALAEGPDGSIYAGGFFTRTETGQHEAVLRYDGSMWWSLPGGPGVGGGGRRVEAIAALPNGDLLVGGAFSTAASGETEASVARWNGSTWDFVGGGLPISTLASRVHDLAVLDGTRVAAVGHFDDPETAGGTAVAAILEDETWAIIARTLTSRDAITPSISAAAALLNGDLVVGGVFDSIEGVPAANLARFDGVSWHAMGEGLPAISVVSLLTLENGDILAGGGVRGGSTSGGAVAARWNGSAWRMVAGGGVATTGWPYGSPAITALARVPSPTGDGEDDVIAVGAFATLDGVATRDVARLIMDASSCCLADMDDGTMAGARDGAVTVDDLVYYIALFEAGATRADVDDGSMAGVRDGAVTMDDLLYYLARFNAGC